MSFQWRCCAHRRAAKLTPSDWPGEIRADHQSKKYRNRALRSIGPRPSAGPGRRIQKPVAHSPHHTLSSIETACPASILDKQRQSCSVKQEPHPFRIGSAFAGHTCRVLAFTWAGQRPAFSNGQRRSLSPTLLFPLATFTLVLTVRKRVCSLSTDCGRSCCTLSRVSSTITESICSYIPFVSFHLNIDTTAISVYGSIQYLTLMMSNMQIKVGGIQIVGSGELSFCAINVLLDQTKSGHHFKDRQEIKKAKNMHRTSDIARRAGREIVDLDAF